MGRLAFWRLFGAVLLCVLVGVAPAMADDAKKGGPPPSTVVTGKVTSGKVAPQVEYIGTVYFHERSDVASEVDGKAVAIEVDSGQRVAKGDVLVRLSTDLHDKRIANARALMEQARADYELARLDDQRKSKLFKSRSVSEGEYDNSRLGAMAAQRKYHALRVTLDRLNLLRDKAFIRAPYDGVILEREVNRGEWVSTGSTVISMGRDDRFDVQVNVPSGSAGVIRQGLAVKVDVGGRTLDGEVYAVVPRGDVSTRTFPIKIKVMNPGFLAEGMEARVSLPSGFANKTLVVPRDAVIAARGNTVVWAVLDGKAVPVPVRVVGYRGLEAGVTAEKLAEGMDVVIKGNERLRPGQPVVITNK
jgi:RND family efflux transporter MFP subunit